MYSKLIAFASAMLLAATLAVTAAGQQENPAEQQRERRADDVAERYRQHEPHMAAALEHLRQAEEELEKAAPNKGGHREKAMQLTTQAQSEVEAGIQWYDANVSPGPGYGGRFNREGKVPLFRLISVSGKDRLYTSSAQERDEAQARGYKYEAIAGYVASSQIPGTVPLYRLVRENAGKVEHFYTADAAERDKAIRGTHYRDEGVSGYVTSFQRPGTVPLERLQSTRTGEYLFTASPAESSQAVARDGYERQGVCCYVWEQ